MTVSFANIQVSAGGEAAPSSRQAVVDAVALRLGGQEGWERVDEPARADRSVLVGPLHGDEWVGVYLDRADRFEEVESFGAALSGELARTAVGFRANGGTLQMSLSRDGERAASIERRGASSEGEISSVWSDPLKSDGGADALRRVFDGTPRPPEELAREVAEQFGMEPRLVAGGYRYLQMNVAGEIDELHYRRVDSSAEIGRIDGAPEFETPDRHRELEASVGDAVRTSTSVGNLGGEVTGIRVTVGGSAIDEGVVEVDAIRLSGGVAQQSVERDDRLDEREEDGGRGVVAEFPDTTVAGALSEDVDLSDLSDERGREVMRAHRASRFSVYARGRAVEPGEGSLTIEVRAANDGETARAPSRIAVHPEPRMPLGASSEHAPSHTLRQMERSGTLFALLHFDTPLGAWMSLASNAISRWADTIAGPEDSFAIVELSEARSRPDERLARADAFVDAERMADRIGDLGDVYQWSAVLQPEVQNQERLEPESTAGFSYFSCGGPESDPGTEPAPALGFWVSVEDRSDEEVASLESRLRELVEEFARSGRVIQAVMSRWNWAPALSLRTLPYEIVCGLDSSGHLRVEWLRQYLRAAAPDLWLGADLWERLDREAVDGVADIEVLGETRRLSLRGGATLDDLEEVLAPVLPGLEEWSDEKS